MMNPQSSTNQIASRSDIHSLRIAIVACTIFLGAFLLFQVQPIMGKYILPWFGGSPGVWTTCMLVFQLLLFGGYAYAHILSSLFGLRAQASIHAVLLMAAACTLPIAPDTSWKPTGDESPSLSIILLLLAKVGAPYFMLSSTGPLLQSWLGQSRCIEQPYRLYSLSNLGSLLALLSFPFLVEPNLSSYKQSFLWSASFILYAILCGATSCLVSRSERRVADGVSAKAAPHSNSRTLLPIQAGWFVLAAIASVLLLATTNQVCMDTAVVPFLWVLPLAIYLVTFILAFEHERWYQRRPYIMLACISFIALFAMKGLHFEVELWIEVAAYFSGLFFSCMVCHGELYQRRPAHHELTRFYITIAAGGAFGGILVGIIAPNLFHTFLEWQIGLLSVVAVFAWTYLDESQSWKSRFTLPMRLAMVTSAIFVTAITVSWSSHRPGTLQETRNFFGILSVVETTDPQTHEPIRNLVHGRIVHGSQFLKSELNTTPTTYYSHNSGVGRLLLSMTTTGRKIGVVGLGAGTIATYGRPGDKFRFYEINPDVIDLANRYFQYLPRCTAQVDTLVGDARLLLEREPDQDFDCLVLDAFSGDAIPVHLLTSEAIDTYRRHLNDRGALAIHISNLYFDLRPIVAGLAHRAGMELVVIENKGMTDNEQDSTWAILTRDPTVTDTLSPIAKKQNPKNQSRLVVWTDDCSNLMEVLR
ncbi:MAG: hypothetical protein FJ308_07355 [Planctomycetes bacterium]|nr:hypothetical protein [Planctomycetota bacterium]